MPNVRVRYYNILRDATGRAEETLPAPALITLRGFLRNVVAQRHPSVGTLLILADGEISPYTRIFRNGEVVSLTGLDEHLNDGDEIRLFPAVAGG